MTVGLQVDNFATLRHAQINLNKLLVLMGPNNSGKSTAAVLLYAACRSIPWRRISTNFSRRSIQSVIEPPEFDRRYISKAANELIIAATNYRTPDELVANFPQSVRSIMTRPMKQQLGVYVRSFSKELERCFGGTLKELVRQPSNGQPTRVQVSHGDQWMVAVSVARGRTSFEVELNEMDNTSWDHAVRKYLDANWARVGRRLRLADVEHSTYILNEIFLSLMQYHFRHFPRTAHYLPASRSGTLQNHRALAAAMIRQSSYAGIEDLAIPKLPGVVADFIGKLLVLNPNRIGPYSEIAAQLEQEVLHGEIELSPAASTAPEINFAAGKVKHALHRTSSMVSELAPIVLFLRHVVDARDLIIIEEPESHLHPASQVGLATTIARLVSSEVSVAITTHSDYFINQVSNLVMKAAIAESGTPQEATGADAVVISPSTASAYLFRPVSPDINSGSMVEELPVTASGISDTEFAKVAEWLYNESALLTQKVNSIDA